MRSQHIHSFLVETLDAPDPLCAICFENQKSKLSRFKNIDDRIKDTAKMLNAKLSIDRPNYPEVLRTFEERRIDWVENSIHKAIIIQPKFTSTGVDSTKWSFINLAWITKKGIAQKPGHRITLINKGDFKEIEDRIHELLSQSITNLQTVKLNDIQNI